MYYAYILYSKTFDKTYVGFTSDLEARLIAHNHEKNSSWTKLYQPYIIKIKASQTLRGFSTYT